VPIAKNIKQISCKYCHSLILDEDGVVWGSGCNSYGQLGLGKNQNYAFGSNTNTFQQIAKNIKQISCGYYHSLILDENGVAWCSGFNQYGQLGLGHNNNTNTFQLIAKNIKQISCGDEYSIILDNDGVAWGSGRNSNGQLSLGQNQNPDFSLNTFQLIAENVRTLANCIEEEETTYPKSARNC
jgi:alpha-tubulin suppressor-like RCC1 family protein